MPSPDEPGSPVPAGSQVTGKLEDGPDPELEKALKKLLEIIHREYPLSPNQILVLSAELQRVGVHRLVEEHLRKFRYRLQAEDETARSR